MQSTSQDPHTQLRALYHSLLDRQDKFDEFKYLLSCYPSTAEIADVESEDAAQVRAELNAKIRSWIGEFDGLSAAQVLQWRVIVVEDRFNVSLSPWKESNMY